MASTTRTALWIAGSTVATWAIAWLFSVRGALYAWGVLSVHYPGVGSIDRGTQLAWQAAGLLVAFLLALLVVRVWAAPPQLWIGALAAVLPGAADYLLRLLEVWRLQDGHFGEVFHGSVDGDPLVQLAAFLGYPLAVGLGCWLASRRDAAPSEKVGEASHA